MKLRDILCQATQDLPDSWLFIAGDYQQWTLDTEVLLVDIGALDVNPETDDPILPVELTSNGFREVLDIRTTADCVRWADRLSGGADDVVRFQSFIYYVRFDAFLPTIGAPDPPPWEEIQRNEDLKFYEKLGPEDSARPCKREGCCHGAIRNSVFCKRHHFEIIKRRDCPFDH